MDGSTLAEQSPDRGAGVELRPASATLRIMATTDLHMHMLGYDYLRDRPVPNIGLHGLAGLIARARAGAPNTLLVDNGDFLQGTPLGDFLAGQADIGRRRIHPGIALMNDLGYDAVTLGNHDFHFGADFLLRALDGARFPVTCANAAIRNDAGRIRPHLLVQRQLRGLNGVALPIRIGILGLTPPHAAVIDRRQTRRVATRDMLTAAAEAVRNLRRAGADLVIALAHSGIATTQGRADSDNLATDIAALTGIDAVVAGHTHMVFPGPGFPADPAIDAERGTLHGKPAVMAGFHGSHLGLIDLMLDWTQAAGWRLAGATVRAVPVQPDPNPRRTCCGSANHRCLCCSDPACTFRTQDAGALPLPPRPAPDLIGAHRSTLRRYRRRIARTETPLNSFFTLLGDDGALRLVAMAQRWQLRQSLGLARRLPVLSAVAPFRAGGRGGPGHYTDVPAGPLTLRSLGDLYLFQNRLIGVEVTGMELADWLERSASIFHRLIPGAADQTLIDPAFPPYFFDVIDGLTWTVDPGRPARYDAEGRIRSHGPGRVLDLRHAGRPVAPEERFLLATNSFRRNACPLFRDLAGRLPLVFEGEVTIPDALRRYVAARRRVQVPPHSSWRFAPLPGTTALFDTAPEALAHLPRLTCARVQSVPVEAGGFVRLRLHL
ncbi:MAG TPA: 5'-nucleotidase C-terminal domain-containing protein [Paracoccus sp. (in: a-proteobacteria)]|nr:5'-nucleotidase C-terminal domain-containing protein [Paracoccus sp. (in: a-proteobacteria)]